MALDLEDEYTLLHDLHITQTERLRRLIRTEVDMLQNALMSLEALNACALKLNDYYNSPAYETDAKALMEICNPNA